MRGLFGIPEANPVVLRIQHVFNIFLLWLELVLVWLKLVLMRFKLVLLWFNFLFLTHLASQPPRAAIERKTR